MTDSELLRLVPEIHRARDWRLYAKDGSRIVDLWQYGGRALLGHSPPGLLRAFKNSAERGLFVPFPHFAEGRLLKALSALLPERRFRLYSGEETLGAALAGNVPPVQNLPVWRPFLEIPSGPLFVPVLPFPFPGAPAVLACNADADTEGLLPGETISPAALAAAARCVWDLIAASPGRGEPRFPKLNIKGNWRRRGIYLNYLPAGDSAARPGRPLAVDEDYAVWFRRFLDQGFLLPPSPSQPAILPGELSPGEEAKLAGLFAGDNPAAVET